MTKEEVSMSNHIRILVTSDVHGSIYPYSYADGTPRACGIAQLYPLIQSLRDENTLLLDNGDTLEGAPLSFYHHHSSPETLFPMTDVMKKMQYDYVNVGNHDFDYGEEALIRHLENVGAPCITNNFIYQGSPYGPNYVIREIAGKKIALLGVTTHFVSHWESPANIQNSQFPDAFTTVQKNVDFVKKLEKPDYIVVLYHGGFERDLQTGLLSEEETGENQAFRMIKSIPGIAVLLAGHQHQSLQGKLDNTVYTETAADGVELACVEIDVGTGVITSKIISGEGHADNTLLERIQKEEDACQKWLDQSLGSCAVDLKITDEDDARMHKSQLITFLNQVQMDATGADVSASALFLHATGFDQQITMRNLVSTYVYPNTLVVKKMSGRILKEYLEKNAEFWSIHSDREIGVNPDFDYPHPQHYNYDMLDGIEYIIQVSNPVGQRITSLTRNGVIVKDTDEFNVCVNNYRASGGGGFSMITHCPTVSVNLSSMVELLADYILKHQIIDFAPVHNIDVIK